MGLLGVHCGPKISIILLEGAEAHQSAICHLSPALDPAAPALIMKGLGTRVQGLGFRVQGLGFGDNSSLYGRGKSFYQGVGWFTVSGRGISE